jgi:hypothetical protein
VIESRPGTESWVPLVIQGVVDQKTKEQSYLDPIWFPSKTEGIYMCGASDKIDFRLRFVTNEITAL